MQNCFTHYWRGDTCNFHVEKRLEGYLLDHVAGSMFVPRGVTVGDRIYAVSTLRGELYLIARMDVGEIVFSDSEARKLLNYEPWPGREHLIAAENTGTPMIFDRVVPVSLVRELRFETPNGPQPAKFAGPGQLDRQTLRGVRQLTPTSALLLDELLVAPKSKARSLKRSQR
jgi:hypothetical protein